MQTYELYLRADQRACLAALENLHTKYATTATDIERKRDAANGLALTRIHARTAATTVKHLSVRDLDKASDLFPSFEQQQRIAEILSTVDEAIEQTEALIAKTQQIKAGLMHDLFTRGVASDGQLKPAIRCSRTQFGLLPQGWVTGSLLDVADEKRQPILTGPFGADLGNDDFVDDGVPVLRIGNVQAGYLELSELLFVTPSKARELARYVVRAGDLLFARQGATTGRNALATNLVDGCLINYHIIRVALDCCKCAPLFIEAAFNGEIVKRQVERDKGRGTREGINTAQLKALQVPLAPINEQRMIAEILLAHNDEIHLLILERDKLRKLKHGLMTDLLSGRVLASANATIVPVEVAANV
ncbi:MULTISPECIES: restriction endonuclease subunit S [unclassified Thiocapsa]|uniref:restriction endonuclease subunit S n=1 Tax=unclassified Thiocapsa TaxID=2641286 RepID=UPI0035ADA302